MRNDTVSSPARKRYFYLEAVMDYPVIDPVGTGINIKNLIKGSGKTVTEMCRILMLSDKSTMYKWFRGETLPGIDNMFALSVLLGVTINDIIVSK